MTVGIGHNTKSQHIDLIVNGMEMADQGEATAVEGHRMVAEGIARILSGINGNTRRLRSELEKRFDSLGPSKWRNDYANRLIGKSDRASQKAATDLRNAYIWMAKHPDQVDWVLANTGARQPKSMHTEWKKHRSDIIAEGMEAGSAPKAIADRLLGEPVKDVQAVIKRKADANERAERKKAEAAAQAEVDRKALEEKIRKELLTEQTPVPTADKVSKELSHLRSFMMRHMAMYVDRKLDILEGVKGRTKCPAEIGDLIGEADDRDKAARALAKSYRDLIAGKDADYDSVLAFASRCRFGAHNAFPEAEAKVIATPEWFRKVLDQRIQTRQNFGNI